MATVKIIRCGRSQSGAGLSAVLAYCMREDKTTHNNMRLISGINCVPEAAFIDMMNTKMQFKKTDGKMFYHMVQSFSPAENITPELAHQIAVEFAQQQFSEYEVVVATHVDAEHIHSHFVWNSVSCENGRKYHSDSGNIQRLRDASDELCIRYGLSVIAPTGTDREEKMSPREYQSAMRGERWKVQLAAAIDDCMRLARTKEDFIRLMEYEGYEVLWTDERKYITYTAPNGMKCRDNKLHENKYTKEMMENEFRIRGEIAAGVEGYRPSAEAADQSGGDADVRRTARYDGEAGRTGEGTDCRTEPHSIEHRDGCEGRGATGWEEYRKAVRTSFSDGRSHGTALQTPDADIPDSFGNGVRFGAALAALSLGFTGSTDDDEDPEERRRRIEAEQELRAFGDVMDDLAEMIEEGSDEDSPITMGGM